MSTHSMIGVEAADGTIRGIYCHWDGYPAHVGAMLLQHYETEAKACALIALGNLSSIAPTIGTKHPFDKCPEGECNYYGRDRGESGTEADTYASAAEFKRGQGCTRVRVPDARGRVASPHRQRSRASHAGDVQAPAGPRSARRGRAGGRGGDLGRFPHRHG